MILYRYEKFINLLYTRLQLKKKIEGGIEHIELKRMAVEVTIRNLHFQETKICQCAH